MHKQNNPLRSNLRTCLDLGVVSWGVLFCLLGKPTTAKVRLSLMRLHCATNGKTSDVLARFLKMFEGMRKPQAVSGVLGSLSVAEQARIVESISTNGFYVFEDKLPAELCDRIAEFARITPAALDGKSPDQPEVFDPANPKSKAYRLAERSIVQNGAIQEVIADPSILAIAEGYIGITPMLSMLNLWWSSTYSDDPGDTAAQQFHFDFDPPPKWLLFFVYLTDVGPDNGPHVFVRGSHKAGHQAASSLLKRGYVRITDTEIASSFGPENIVEIHGKRGTILAVDTRGFHKGKTLTQGHRLMAQLTYSYPTFSGAHGGVERLKNDLVLPQLLSAARALPKVFSRYLQAK
jgi:hypothetical protein